MGRLSLVIALVAVVALFAACVVACEKDDAGATVSRSEQVIASGPLPTAVPDTGTGTGGGAHVAAVRTKKLCDGDGNAKGRTLSKTPTSHVEAPGAARLDGPVAARGAWTWINFWAAWCGPCKEEMPRLVSWQDKLAKAGTPVRFVFVSLDDDARQLEQFLDKQPAEGIKSSLWLPDGPARASWLGALKMKSAPELPEQALVDPQGHVRCFIEGAVEDGDYAEISALVGH